jgi:hypothetical protein
LSIPATLSNAAPLLACLAFAGRVLGEVIAFDRGPIALMPGTIGGRITLRSDEDPPPGHDVPMVGCGLAFVAGIDFRCGRFLGRLAPGTALAVGNCADRGGRNGVFRRFFVGRAAWFTAGQCSSLCYLRAAADHGYMVPEWLRENNTWSNSSRKTRRIPRGRAMPAKFMPLIGLFHSAVIARRVSVKFVGRD